MKVLPYTPEMYEEVASWWQGHAGWEAIPAYLLPSVGFVVSGDNLLCAGFLYKDGSSPVGMMEWVVANPENTPRTSLKALQMLLQAFADYADDNKLVMFTTLRQERLAGLYKRVGFLVGDSGMTNMTRIP